MTNKLHDIIYIIIIIVLFYNLKLSLLFKPTGEPREFGVGYDKNGYKKTFFTMFTFIIILILCIN